MNRDQLPLRFGAMVDAEPVYQELLRAIERVASVLGKGAVADQLGMHDASFSHALRDRERHAFKAQHLVALLLLDDGDVLLELLAAAKGKTLHTRRQLTDAEKLERLRGAVRRRLGELGQDLIEEASK